LPDLTESTFDILITGIGGTGVVTIGALLGMAAHLEGKGVIVLDQTGLAQKGGAVTTHVRVGARPDAVRGTHIPDGRADLLLGCDLVVSAGNDILRLTAPGRTRAVVNLHETVTAEFTRQSRVYRFPGLRLRRCIEQQVGTEAASFIDANALATALLGDSIAANPFMLGYAWQKGLLPVSEEALLRAIELNGVAVELNKRAFLWGRHAAYNLDAVQRLTNPAAPPPPAESLEALVERRKHALTDYQNATYAARYEKLVQRVAVAESSRAPGRSGLAEAVARNFFKLMAYKDEYEVARLMVGSGFLARVDAMFEGGRELRFHLAPPMLARRDPVTGHLRKREFGPWILPVFRVLARLRRLRGTALDPFGYTTERRTERQLIDDYEALMEEVAARLDSGNHGLAVELASIPDAIRGFGHVKTASLQDAKRREAELLATFRAPPHVAAAAE
jgi:indolepyruvate ferredoxin oxidoreductase